MYIIHTYIHVYMRKMHVTYSDLFFSLLHEEHIFNAGSRMQVQIIFRGFSSYVQEIHRAVFQIWYEWILGMTLVLDI